MGSVRRLGSRKFARVLFVVFVLTAVCAAVPAQALANGWTIVPSPSPHASPQDGLADVSCVSASSCVAVGSGYGVALTEVWNGTRWSLFASPTPVGRRFDGVSCLTASKCFAVGVSSSPYAFSGTTLVERWNGTSWTILASPNPAGAAYSELASISCLTQTDCYAVGLSRTETPQTQVERALVEHWNGTAWSIVASPHPQDGADRSLSAVTCTSTTDCVAVGSARAFTSRTLVEHWNGTAWSIVASPSSPSSSVDLTGVSCTASTNCFAVGTYSVDNFPTSTQHPLIEHWNGTRWSTLVVPTPPGAPDNILTKVSCTTAQSCVAVGLSSDLSANLPSGSPLIEKWNGANWSLSRGATRSDAAAEELLGVDCTSSTNCVAVGVFLSALTGAVGTLVEKFGGTAWSVVPSPSRRGPRIGGLSGVACPSTTSCFAVGASQSGALIEHWDSTAWSITPNPDARGPFSAGLESIACPTVSSCVAVGGKTDASGFRPLIEHWNGTGWSDMASPHLTSDSNLTGVACPAATGCFAVGTKFSPTGLSLISEHWDGHTWTMIPTPQPTGAFLSLMSHVSCSSTTDCYAVGTTVGGGTSFGTQTALVEHWNGTRWKLVALPVADGAALYSVSCNSTTRCMAVGASTTTSVSGTSFHQKPLAENWNGARWSVVPTPTPSTATAALVGVTCTNKNNCYAVGQSSNHTLIEHWDGIKWSVVTSPNAPFALSSSLNGVACTSATACFAVGSLIRPGTGVSQTVIERRT